MNTKKLQQMFLVWSLGVGPQCKNKHYLVVETHRKNILQTIKLGIQKWLNILAKQMTELSLDCCSKIFCEDGNVFFVQYGKQ